MAMIRSKSRQNSGNSGNQQRGFSAIEMLITLALLTVVLGVVVKGIIELQARNFNENGKVDSVQEARDFIDQMARDIHGSGYPPPAVVTQASNSGCNNATIRAQVNIACGIISFSTTSVQYEADLDGSGTVSVVYLNLIPPTGSTNCPCILQRGTVTKAQANAGTAPAYFTTVNGILNSGDGTGNDGSGAPTYALSMSGTGSYASYANADVFNAYDAGAGLITTACNWTTTPNCTQIKSVQITANVAPPYYDPVTKLYPVYSITSRARINF
jgi:prepilin-type N-terminal cleavage/methylation domain-containing protein